MSSTLTLVVDPYVLVKLHEEDICNLAELVRESAKGLRRELRRVHVRESEIITYVHRKRTDIHEFVKRRLELLLRCLFERPPIAPRLLTVELSRIVELSCDEESRPDIVKCEHGVGNMCSHLEHYKEYAKIAARMLDDLYSRVRKGPVLLLIPRLSEQFRLTLDIGKIGLCRCVMSEKVELYLCHLSHS